jgi:hypothetical protein
MWIWSPLGAEPEHVFAIAAHHGTAGLQPDTHCWRPCGVDDWGMVQFAIRCQPRVPVSADELEGWLEWQVEELRAQAPRSVVRLSRLTQGRTHTGLDVGWLIELELDEREPLLAGDGLADALRDMRLLGLQPTLLAPREAWTNGRAA